MGHGDDDDDDDDMKVLMVMILFFALANQISRLQAVISWAH